MKHTWTMLATLALTAGFVAWKLHSADREPSPPDAAGPPEPAAQPAPPEPEEPVSGRVAPDTPPTTLVDPAGRVNEASPARCNWENIFFTNPLTGEPEEARHCVPAYPPEPDPYESFSSETLASMAYGDAHAAEVLGLRLLNTDDPAQEAISLSLLYRAAALSGSLEPLRKAIGKRYAYTRINDELQIANLKQLLVFGTIGQTLNDDRFHPEFVEALLIEAGTDPATIDSLRARAAKLLKGMADIETNVTGNTTIREALGKRPSGTP